MKVVFWQDPTCVKVPGIWSHHAWHKVIDFAEDFFGAKDPKLRVHQGDALDLVIDGRLADGKKFSTFLVDVDFMRFAEAYPKNAQWGVEGVILGNFFFLRTTLLLRFSFCGDGFRNDWDLLATFWQMLFLPTEETPVLKMSFVQIVWCSHPATADGQMARPILCSNVAK